MQTTMCLFVAYLLVLPGCSATGSATQPGGAGPMAKESVRPASEVVVPWEGPQPHLAMVRRGDALITFVYQPQSDQIVFWNTRTGKGRILFEGVRRRLDSPALHTVYLSPSTYELAAYGYDRERLYLLTLHTQGRAEGPNICYAGPPPSRAFLLVFGLDSGDPIGRWMLGPRAARMELIDGGVRVAGRSFTFHGRSPAGQTPAPDAVIDISAMPAGPGITSNR